MPIECFRFLPDQSEDMFFPIKKTVLRKIYYGAWPIQDLEATELRKFKDYLHSHKLELPPAL